MNSREEMNFENRVHHFVLEDDDKIILEHLESHINRDVEMNAA